MLKLYQTCMGFSEGLLNSALLRRQKAGKESAERLEERKGIAGRKRPAGKLIWLHAASVGEAQSALILIKTLLQDAPDAHILVTTGTLSSANMMEHKLPERAFHQFYPLDHPEWTERFLEHWKPDLIFWMESELWPNMLLGIQKRDIPAIMVNARLSPRSYGRWALFKSGAKKLLSTFDHILCQTEQDAAYFKNLGADQAVVTDNLKYSAAPLPADEDDLEMVSAAMRGRPCWVYASTHKGEEALACRVHEILKSTIPDLLTVIIPRHPERRDDIAQDLESSKLNVAFRGENKTLPDDSTDIYIADTFGELGLFYRACDVACIGRSFSDDGGGGHNPIEAAQLHCAVLHGPDIQNLQEIFDEMNRDGAAMRVSSEQALIETLQQAFLTPAYLEEQKEAAYNFARKKEQVLDTVMDFVTPYLNQHIIGALQKVAHDS